MIERFSFLPGLKKDKSQVELSDATKRKKYDVLAALSKALLVFMLSFGAIGGFLSAYDIDYNRTISGLGILLFAILLALIYETEKRWFTNLCVIGIFIIYAYMAVSRFWLLNSGAYAVINEIYQQAQNYLGVAGVGMYQLKVEDTYQTVTAISLFVGVVLDILLVLRLQYKASLFRTILLTFSAYFVPIYFECTPDLFYLFLLLAGYVSIAILQCSDVKKHISSQIKQVLPVGMAISAILVFFFGMFLPNLKYHGIVHKNPQKEATEKTAVDFAQYGLVALFMGNNRGSGVAAGKLNQNQILMPDNETDLIVRYTPYSMEPVYLKSFTGRSYDGRQWSNADTLLDDSEGFMTDTVAGRKALYEENPAVQPKGIMEVLVADRNIREDFRPYYTEKNATGYVYRDWGSSDMEESAVWYPMTEGENQPGGELIGGRYTYYPMVNGTEVPGAGEKLMDPSYLEVPVICRKAVADACKEAALMGDPEQIVEQIDSFFNEKYAYTLRPGYYFGGMDYISYFLAKNKKGVCTHFASAGTMMLRYMGIPARYVEGYVVTYTNVVTDGKILEEEKYEDYYDGYAPMEKTAVVEVEVSDAQAHAWIEIYLEDKGWTVVDVTPANSLDDEETASFWDAILGTRPQNTGDGNNAQDTTDYLGEALSGGMSAIGILLMAVFLFFLGKCGYGKYQESKLPGLKRVQLEYGRLTGPLKEKNPAFATLTTPGEELDFIREHYGVDVSESLKEELYQTFFAPQKGQDYEKLRKTLTEIRKKCKV